MIAWIAAATLAARLAAAGQASQPAQPARAGSSTDAISIDGHIALSGDGLPAMDVAELRPQLMLDVRGGLGSGMFRYRVQAIFEALVRLRGASAGQARPASAREVRLRDASAGQVRLRGASAGQVRLRGASAGQAQIDDDGTRITDAIARFRDAWIQAASARGDLRAGYGRVIWGRLDEIQPSDVINPLDVSRFLFDGRSEARLPVAFVRGRLFVREGLTIEGVLAPVFERGRFDELEEPSSPFNLINNLVIPVLPSAATGASTSGFELRRIEPERTWSNMSGGARVSTTIGRLDLSGSVYRGFESFGVITFDTNGPATLPVIPELKLVEQYPRFTMIAGDFETIRGEWALRGEAAFFVDKQLAGPARLDAVPGQAFDAGIGLDRRSGDYRVFASAIVHREWSDRERALTKADLNLVGSIDRDLARGRYFIRGFAVANPADASVFLRVLFVWKVRDDVSMEGSTAAFLGTSDDTLGRFQDRDFLLARIRYRW